MTLPASGNPISFSQVDVELSFSATAQISLNDTAVRTLFGVASGAISLSNGYGKSSVVSKSFHTVFGLTGNNTYDCTFSNNCTLACGYQDMVAPPAITTTATYSWIAARNKAIKQSLDGTINSAVKYPSCGCGVSTVSVATDSCCNLYRFGSFPYQSCFTYCSTYGAPTGHVCYVDGFVVKYNSSGTTPSWAIGFGNYCNFSCTNSHCQSYTTIDINSVRKVRVTDGLVDSSGNSYVTGVVPRDKGNHKSSSFITKINSSGIIQWSLIVLLNPGANGDNYESSFQNLVLDSSGNIYAAGLVNYTTGNQNGQLYVPVIIKVNTSGSVVWLKRLNSSSGTTSFYQGGNLLYGFIDITSDSSDNIYVSTGINDTSLARPAGAVLVKMNSSGTVLWSRKFQDSYQGNSYGPAGRPCFGNVQPKGLKTDQSNNVYFSYGAGVSAGSGNAPISAYSWTLMLNKVNSCGSLQWTRYLGMNNQAPISGARIYSWMANPHSLSVDKSGSYFSHSIYGRFGSSGYIHHSLFRAPTDGSLYSNNAYAVGQTGPGIQGCLNPAIYYYSLAPWQASQNLASNPIFVTLSNISTACASNIVYYTAATLFTYTANSTVHSSKLSLFTGTTCTNFSNGASNIYSTQFTFGS
jgi:hypothetical protein